MSMEASLYGVSQQLMIAAAAVMTALISALAWHGAQFGTAVAHSLPHAPPSQPAIGFLAATAHV